MTRTVADSLVDWAATYRDDPRLSGLLGPGAPFEVEMVVVDGVELRSFVRAPKTIVDAFQTSRAHEALTHIVYEEQRWTFGEVRRQALSLARELKARYGVGEGDRVALAMRNLPEFVVGFWAGAVLGAIVVPLNSWWTGAELAYALDDSGAKVVFADDERTNRLASAGFAGSVIRVRSAMTEAHGSMPIEELTSGAPLSESEFAGLGSDDPVTILYTSGTTGHPKGAVNTNRATIANLMNMAFSFAREAILAGRTPAPTAQPASVTAAPLFHIGGMAAIVGGAMSGSKMVLMTKWNAANFLALAEAEGVTQFGGVPTMAREILDVPDLLSYKINVRGFPLGGAAVPPDLPRRALETFGPSIQLLNGYGCTETTSAVVTNVGVEYAARMDSVGRPNLTADIQVQDPEGKPLERGQLGELCFRSPQNAKGYWNRPEDTHKAFVEGWFHTGDVGYVDDDGFVYVVDRLKDVVIRGGENVYCAEVEGALFEHPGVADVAVIGLPDARMGERVCAVVVPREGASITLEDLRRFVAANLAAFKRPEALFLTAELPRTATGKTAKPALRKTVTDAIDKVQRAY